MNYYLIETEYVGPNKKDSSGSWLGDTATMEIRTQPGRTNMSHQERTDGWLGTTNDWWSGAHGEFDTLEAARAEAHRLGFTETPERDVDDLDEQTERVETWVRPEANREQWDAREWTVAVTYPSRDGYSVHIDGLDRITAKTTDDELSAMEREIDLWADEAGVEIHGTMDMLESLREWCNPGEEDEE